MAVLSDQKVGAQVGSAEAERIGYQSQGRLILRRFLRHKLARLGLIVLAILYFAAIFADFVAPYASDTRFRGAQNAPPSAIHFDSTTNGLRTPFVYARQRTTDPNTFQTVYTEITDKEYTLKLFVHGERYKFLGLIESDLHLFGVDGNVPINLFGTDDVSRDLFSRVIIGARISLFVGFVGVAISFILGCIIGGISGLLGGLVDEVIQRVVDLLISIPTLPLWMALTAAIPRNWSVVQTYFAITLVLSVVGWAGLARVVRGKLLSMRDLDFVVAARISGAGDLYIVIRHLLPNFASYLIVSMTLAIPGMILGETALSFIGLGMQEPGVSWGVLLQNTMNITAIAFTPWKLIPVVFVFVTVLMFNFVGDGLRDAADPYSIA
ncbi:MAG: ABC transporter permease [Aggregatilineales bacterium]